MQFETKIHSRCVKRVEDRPPPLRQFLECRFDEPLRALRPGINVRPCQGARKRRMRFDSQVRGSFRRKQKLFHGPGLPRDRVSSHRSEEHTSELQSRGHLVCRLLLEKKKANLQQSKTRAMCL